MDCGTCKRKCSTPGADWWTSYQLRYCQPQIRWYFANIDDIRGGKWPPSPFGSNYTDASIRSGQVKIPSKAAEDFAAEVDARLIACGFAGLCLEVTITETLTIHKLAEYHHCDDEEIYRLIRKAWAYITGWNRKKTLFKDF
jgi:hypothetical protein